MGTLSHHRSKAGEYLRHADRAISSCDPDQAAVTLRRAASHITTALAVQQGWKHNSRRRLESVLQAAVSADCLSRSHLKTFRQSHSHAANPAHYPQTALRRMRRRVASLIKHAAALIAGRPKPVVHHKLWQRKPNLPVPPDFTRVQDIIRLPNFLDIQQRFGLHSVALAAAPDPHGCYPRGEIPRPCHCHAALWNKPQDPARITLSPPWRSALEKTFRIRLPNPLQLTD